MLKQENAIAIIKAIKAVVLLPGPLKYLLEGGQSRGTMSVNLQGKTSHSSATENTFLLLQT